MTDKLELQNLIVALLRAQLRREELPVAVQNGLTEDTLAGIFKLAKHHDIAHILAQALECALLPKTELAEAFFAQRQMAVYRYEQINYEYLNLCRAFENEKIFFIPLKGAVIRTLYPEPWMRTSCDIDILVDEADLGRAENACEALGYELQSRNFHDVSYHSPGGVHLELHFSICENIPAFDKVLKRYKDYLRPVRDTGYEYAFDPEFFMFHNIAHAAYHFLQGGCGVRAVVDLWLLWQKADFDEAIVKSLCRESGLEKFYLAIQELASVWFDGAAPTDRTKNLQNYIFDGGVYGTIENKAGVSATKSSRVRTFWWYAFLPLSIMQISYPILKKHKWLLPACWVARWMKILFRKGGISKETRRSMTARSGVTNEEKAKTAALLKDLELLK